MQCNHFPIYLKRVIIVSYQSAGRGEERTPALSEIEQKIGVVFFLLSCPVQQCTLKQAEVFVFLEPTQVRVRENEIIAQ